MERSSSGRCGGEGSCPAPPIIGKDPFHLDEYKVAQETFHLAFGQTLGQWALIEERLSYWFEDATNMPFEMARAIFFAPRTFQARTDVLEAALANNFQLPPDALEFIKGATTHAGRYSSFRNQLAHGEQTFDARAGSPTHKQIVLISGKHHPLKAAENAVTVDRLNLAAGRIRELAKLLMDALESVHGRSDRDTPEQCRQLVNALPNQADSPKPDRNP